MDSLLTWLRSIDQLYLWLNLLSLAGPLLLSFDKKVAFYKLWPHLFIGILVGAAVFIPWDSWFTSIGVWSFNYQYLIGIQWLNLPLEEWLFFLVIPYCTVFIYECWRCYSTPRMGVRTADIVTSVLVLLSVLLSVRYYDRWYTVITFSVLAVLLPVSRTLLGARFLGLAYLGWLVSLVPFFLVNGVLTAVPVVRYNDAENIGIRLGSIPFEDGFYGFVLYLIVLSVLEIRRKLPEIR